jgi:hypothetical protein
MTHVQHLVETVFTTQTKFGKVPSTLEEYKENFSSKDYEKVLTELLIGLGYFEDID